MVSEVPFSLVRHFPLVRTLVDDARPATFEFDTGAGITIVSEPLLQELNHPPLGLSHQGRRMTGQELSLPLFELSLLSLGRHRQARPVVGGYDLSPFRLGDGSLDGILSLSFFEGTPVALDYTNRKITVHPEGAPPQPEWGNPIRVDVPRRGPEAEMFLDLALPNGRRVKAEVDTGCDRLILDRRFMEELGVQPGTSGASEHRETDETGHERVSHQATLDGRLTVADAPSLAQENPRAVFMDIIYDAVVGFDFLKQYAVTFDTTGSRMFFASPI